ncbi:MAG: hypothetical protein LAQ69_36975 [Acidobacteriia bacterium]|nr:hypothetical protein [Terriglobia bacterium]
MELLDRMAERARALRAAMSDIVWTVDPREDRLSGLVLRMRQTAYTMLETDGRRASRHRTTSSVCNCTNLRRHAILFFKAVVTNSARHAGASAVRLEVGAAGGVLRMSVRDNGCGFDPQGVRQGQGLKSLRYRAQEMHATLRLDSAPGQGTEIELSIPLGR